MPENEPGLESIAEKAKQIREEQAAARSRHLMEQAAVIKEMADMAEGNLTLDRQYKAGRDAGSALLSASRKRNLEAYRASESLVDVQHRKKEVENEVNELRKSLQRDTETAGEAEKLKFDALLKELEENASQLQQAALNDEAEAQGKLGAIRERNKEIAEKYQQIFFEQEQAAREPVQFAVAEVLKARRMNRGEIPPYAGEFGPVESLTTAVGEKIDDRRAKAEALREISAVKEGLDEFSERLTHYEQELQTSRNNADSAFQDFESGETLEDLRNRAEAAGRLRSRAAGAWFGKERKSDESVTAGKELSEMKKSALGRVQAIYDIANEATRTMFEDVSYGEDSTKERPLNRYNYVHYDMYLRPSHFYRGTEFLDDASRSTLESNRSRLNPLEERKKSFVESYRKNSIELYRRAEDLKAKIEKAAKIE